VCAGEGDAVFPRLVRQVLAGEAGGGLPGILGRGAGGGGAGGQSPLVRDLDALRYPDYDDYFAQLAASVGSGEAAPKLLLETSRGCWWGEKHHCTFCGLNSAGMADRGKSPAR